MATDSVSSVMESVDIVVPEQDKHFLQYRFNIEDQVHALQADLKLSKQHLSFASVSERESQKHPLEHEFSVYEDMLLLFTEMAPEELAKGDKSPRRVSAQDFAKVSCLESCN